MKKKINKEGRRSMNASTHTQQQKVYLKAVVQELEL
jgi:hypothetical protein